MTTTLAVLALFAAAALAGLAYRNRHPATDAVNCLYEDLEASRPARQASAEGEAQARPD